MSSAFSILSAWLAPPSVVSVAVSIRNRSALPEPVVCWSSGVMPVLSTALTDLAERVAVQRSLEDRTALEVDRRVEPAGR